jgi:hypothetical protein
LVSRKFKITITAKKGEPNIPIIKRKIGAKSKNIQTPNMHMSIYSQ